MISSEMPTRIREWTVEEYHRMIETGILAADDRVELLGQILEMNPQRPVGLSDQHSNPDDLFVKNLGEKPGSISSISGY